MDAQPARPFTLVRLREGYSIPEVEQFLADVTRALQGRLPDQALATRIERVMFTPVRLRRAYDMGEVDEHLDRLHQLASQGHLRI